jgi:hypothetical protein
MATLVYLLSGNDGFEKTEINRIIHIKKAI